jgi:hypothetical protein
MKKRTMAILATGVLMSLGGVAMAGVSFWTSWFSEEGSNWRACGGNYGVQAVQASGNYSDNLALGCNPWPLGNLASDADSVRTYWSRPFSEEGETGIEKTQCALFADGHEECDTIPTGTNLHVCFGGFGSANKGVVTGMACSGSNCDNLQLLCKKPTSGRLGNCSWSGWFSDEQHVVDFGPGRFITGVLCNSHLCDNMKYYVCSAQW